MAEKKRYTFSFTEDTAEKFEELVKFYSIQKSGVVTLLIREAYEKNRKKDRIIHHPHRRPDHTGLQYGQHL